MKLRSFLLLAVAGGCVLVGASTLTEVISAERFVVFNDRAEPVVVASVDEFGAGVFVVYDALGKEVFAVRDGKIVAPSLKAAATAAPAQSKAIRDPGEKRAFRTFWPPNDLIGLPHDPRTEDPEAAKRRTIWEPEREANDAYPVGEEPRNHYFQDKSPPNMISAERITVFNNRGEPIVVASVDEFGAGVFVVYDALGNEVFAVRDGKVFAPSLKRTATPAQSKPKRDPIDQRIRRARQDSRRVYQPDMLGKKPYLAIELLDWADVGPDSSGRGKWRVTLRVTNASAHFLKRVVFVPLYDGERVRSQDPYGPLSVGNLARGSHDLVLFTYVHANDEALPRRLAFKITDVSTDEGRSRQP